ncbi:MAG: alpha/beta hydrolase [Pirellulaceae bacterium]
MHESHHQPVPKSATPLTMRTPLRTLPWLLCSLLLGLAAAQAREQPATQSFIYKQTRQTELELIVHNPPDWKETDKRPAIVFFFGGGWTGGKIEQFEPQASHLARRGMVAVRADYRVKSRHRVTPKECVEDAKSAVRWIRQNAAKLGVDPERIVAAGGSAGGHIAACTAFTPGLDAEGEDVKISSKPNALVLFNPVLRFERIPELMERIGNDEVVGKAISPTLHLAKDSPPALIFFGTADRLAIMGDEFMKKSKELGHRAELFTAEGQPHGFFNRSPWLEKTTQRMDEFLASLSYLPPRENGAEFPVGQEDGRSFTIETNRPEDRVEIRREGDSATLVVFSQSGIGRATITTTSGNWPTTVILHLHLAGLEHLAISTDKVKLTGSVLSHGGNTARLSLTGDGSGEERALETTIKVFDANGKPVTGLPGNGGHFEITLPKTLLTGRPNRLELEWIDFYRG